jgi:hypothetical protein
MKDYSKNYSREMPSEKDLMKLKLIGEIITLKYILAELKLKLRELEKEESEK